MHHHSDTLSTTHKYIFDLIWFFRVIMIFLGHTSLFRFNLFVYNLTTFSAKLHQVMPSNGRSHGSILRACSCLTHYTLHYDLDLSTVFIVLGLAKQVEVWTKLYLTLVGMSWCTLLLYINVPYFYLIDCMVKFAFKLYHLVCHQLT